MRKKIVIIGAGSAMFTQGLVMDLIKKPGIYNWHLALVDIDSVVLESIRKLTIKMITAKKADIEISSSTDRCDVLPDADYIICAIGVGGRRAWEYDVYIPRKYGIYQPVGDTAMPGGISRAMRMVPAILDIIKDVERICPNARFFNYSNPMAVICRAISKTTRYPVTGLCIGVPGSEWYIADTAGLDRSRITSYAAGMNHLTFIYDFRYDGKDAWPLVRNKLHDVFHEDFDDKIIDRFYKDGGISSKEFESIGEPFSWSFFLQFGAYPAPGDRHVAEFFTERFPNGKYYGKTLGVDAYPFELTIKYGDDIHQNVMNVANSEDPLTDEFFSHVHGEQEQLMEIIDSIENDRRKTFSVNMPNHGAIPNLPWDAVVEMPAAATGKGFCPLMLNDFPDLCASIVAKNLAICEITVDAALKGDRGLFAEAILAGGYMTDPAAVKSMVDEMIDAQKQYLPQF
ncbi:MAG: family 4 glycosyl hydrolase [Saccharofermentanales bacterium]